LDEVGRLIGVALDSVRRESTFAWSKSSLSFINDEISASTSFGGTAIKRIERCENGFPARDGSS
jgi:hypothetical protein